MSGVLTFNGRTSTEMGLKVSGFEVFNAPERIYDSFQVPGRNGDLQIDTGTYSNAVVAYDASMINFTPDKAKAVRVWLLASGGYMRLEDTYNPEEFRLAKYSGPVEWSDFSQMLRHSNVQLVFDSKPQRFLIQGDMWQDKPTSLTNPTAFNALPYIEIKTQANAAELRIGNCTINIGNLNGIKFYLDAETCDAVGVNGENYNSHISIHNALILPPGTTSIEYPGINICKIKPRWWTL